MRLSLLSVILKLSALAVAGAVPHQGRSPLVPSSTSSNVLRVNDVDLAEGFKKREEDVDLADGFKKREEDVDIADGFKKREEDVDLADGFKKREEDIDIADGFKV